MTDLWGYTTNFREVFYAAMYRNLRSGDLSGMYRGETFGWWWCDVRYPGRSPDAREQILTRLTKFVQVTVMHLRSVQRGRDVIREGCCKMTKQQISSQPWSCSVIAFSVRVGNSFLIFKGNTLPRRACIYRRVRRDLIEVSQQGDGWWNYSCNVGFAQMGFGLSFGRAVGVVPLRLVYRTSFASFMGAIGTCKRAFAIPRKRVCVVTSCFQMGRIDRADLEQNVPPVTRLYVRPGTADGVVAFVVGWYLFVSAIGTPRRTVLTREILLLVLLGIIIYLRMIHYTYYKPDTDWAPRRHFTRLHIKVVQLFTLSQC